MDRRLPAADKARLVVDCRPQLGVVVGTMPAAMMVLDYIEHSVDNLIEALKRDILDPDCDILMELPLFDSMDCSPVSLAIHLDCRIRWCSWN